MAEVEASLAFYFGTLGFKVDLRLADDDGKVFLGSVEVGDTVIMFESPGPKDPPDSNRGARSGVKLTICVPEGADIDAMFADVRDKGVPIACDIGDRCWGNRDFTVRDPDGYHVTIARPMRKPHEGATAGGQNDRTP